MFCIECADSSDHPRFLRQPLSVFFGFVSSGLSAPSISSGCLLDGRSGHFETEQCLPDIRPASSDLSSSSASAPASPASVDSHRRRMTLPEGAWPGHWLVVGNCWILVICSVRLLFTLCSPLVHRLLVYRCLHCVECTTRHLLHGLSAVDCALRWSALVVIFEQVSSMHRGHLDDSPRRFPSSMSVPCLMRLLCSRCVVCFLSLPFCLNASLKKYKYIPSLA